MLAMLDDIQKRIKQLQTQLDQLKDILDFPLKEKKIKSIQEEMAKPNFWDDSIESNKYMRELKYLKICVEPLGESFKRLKDLEDFVQLSFEDESMLRQIEQELSSLEREINILQIQNILNGPFDRNNAIMMINAGAGGTESCDWASMLLRMYSRWAENKKYKIKILDIFPGEEAGIKNVTLSIEGEMVYGYLKAEKGVHRLVRISPFDANKRRHTSFASVGVIPEIEDDQEVDIKSEDLRIDVYRSSGPGGQSVNTTDSAVRITHIPTGIVVQSQNERSQLQNRQNAMKILRSKLYDLKMKEQEEQMAKEYGKKQKIEWGSQIRSYVMHPYSLVKDHRTDVETGNVTKVMDGEIDLFMEAFLKWKPGS